MSLELRASCIVNDLSIAATATGAFQGIVEGSFSNGNPGGFSLSGTRTALTAAHAAFQAQMDRAEASEMLSRATGGRWH